MRKIVALGVGIALFASPLVVSAQSLADLQSLMQSLMAQLSALQEQVNQSQIGIGVTQPVSKPQELSIAPRSCPTIARTLWRGLRGDDVMALQNYLISQGYLADDSASGFYGTATEAAVQKWQASISLITSGSPATTGWGVFGEQSRSALSKRCNLTGPVSCPIQPIVDCAPGYGPTSGGYDANGCEQRTRCVPVPKEEGYLGASLSAGKAPLTITFSAPASSGGNTIDFGDGTLGATCAGIGGTSPGAPCNLTGTVHTYTSAGTYVAKLYRANTAQCSYPLSNCTPVATVRIVVSVASGATFSATPISGGAPLRVNFTAYSSGPAQGYSVDFGDGYTSLVEAWAQPSCAPGITGCDSRARGSVSHTYSSAGTYTAKLLGSGCQQYGSNQTGSISCQAERLILGSLTITVSGTQSQEACSFKSQNGTISTSGAQGLGTQHACLVWCTDIRTEKYGAQSGGICRYTSTDGVYREMPMEAGISALTASLDASTPAHRNVEGGSTNVKMLSFRLRPSGESMRLETIGVTLAAGSPASIQQVKLYRGYDQYGENVTTPVGTAIFAGSSRGATIALTGNNQLNRDTDSVFTLMVDLARVGTGQPGIAGDVIKLQLDDPIAATGLTSGRRLYGGSSGSIVSPGITLSGGSSSGGITVTSPNGGERWEIGQLNTITWTPYSYTPTTVNGASDVSVYLEKVYALGLPCWDSNAACDSYSYNPVGRVMDTGKASLHTYFNIDSYSKWAEPGQYVVRAVNNKTGASDRSNAPFTLLPSSVVVKINGSDQVTVADNQLVTVSWSLANYSYKSCTLDGVRLTPGGAFNSISVPPSSSGAGSYYAFAPHPGSNSVVKLTCLTTDGQEKYDYAAVLSSQVSTPSSVKVVTPNGGEQILGSNLSIPIRWSAAGVSSASIALYKNDQWYQWIARDVISEKDVNSHTWNFGGQITDGDVGKNIFKIYVTAQKSDGSGYVDDKSDAPFSFAASAQKECPVIQGPDATVGVAYRFDPGITNYGAPEPSLPSGLTKSNGIIQGTPTAAGSYSGRLYTAGSPCDYITVNFTIKAGQTTPQCPTGTVLQNNQCVSVVPPVERPLCGLFRGGTSTATNMIASPNPASSVADTNAACIQYCDYSGWRAGDMCMRGSSVIKTYAVVAPVSSAVPSSWKAFNFLATSTSSCSGARYVGYSAKYGTWVGAQLCGSSSKYKLYMSSSEQGVYYQIADYGGHGQDHCELINSTFTIPNDDDITSGTCKNCSLGSLVDVQNEQVFARSRLGEPFRQVTSVDWGDLTTDSYSCGVSIGATAQASGSTQLASALSALEEALKALLGKIR